jgi:antitoxin component of MazEF toxin-antitoxin module
MIKTLTTHGNSLALILEKGVLNLLNIKKKTPLEITTDGTNIIISPVRSAAREKAFQSALATVNRKHGRTLKSLAG